MERVWRLLPEPEPGFYDLFPELPKTVAKLLYHRNIRTQEAIDEFLNPDYSEDVHDPFLFRDMEKAVARIFTAIENNERITIHGDYDADGVSASVILANVFNALKFTNYTVFLPHREHDGYGLAMKTIDLLHSEGTTLIITCDCGISNTPEIARARDHGMDVIITDHHAMPAELPKAFATIHPKVPDETYPDKNLAGGGVAFKLMQGILKTHAKTHERLPNGERHEAFEKWQLDMAAIASVADMVPLIGESRTLTKYGLIVLNKTKRIGLQKLLLEARLLDESGAMKREITADVIGFQIAPRINAAGRMEHANVAYNLLMASMPEDAAELALQLDQNNADRQKRTEELVREGSKQIEANQMQEPVLVVIGDDWSPGIVGLIASRLKDKYEKPVFALARFNGNIMGSGRSIKAFNMVKAMQTMPELFSKYGGHPMACGFTLATPGNLDAFIKRMREAHNTQTETEDLTPIIPVDAEVTLDEVNWELYDILDKFKPFGQMNEKPKYMAKNLYVHALEPVGKDGKHLRILVKQDGSHVVRKTIGWRLCHEDNEINWGKELKIGDRVNMVFEMDVNEWNGNREIQLTIVDLEKK